MTELYFRIIILSVVFNWEDVITNNMTMTIAGVLASLLLLILAVISSRLGQINDSLQRIALALEQDIYEDGGGGKKLTVPIKVLQETPKTKGNVVRFPMKGGWL